MPFKIACLCPPLMGHATPMVAFLEHIKKKGYDILFFNFFELELPLYHSFKTVRIPNNFSKNLKNHQVAYKDVKELITPLSKFYLYTYKTVKQIVTEYEPDLLLIDHYYSVGEIIANELNIKYIICYSSPDIFLIDREDNSIKSKINLLTEQKKYQFYEDYMLSKTNLPIKHFPFSTTNNLCFAPEILVNWNTKAFKNNRFNSPYNSNNYPLSFILPPRTLSKPTTEDYKLREKIKNTPGIKIFVSFGTVWTRLINTKDIADKLKVTIKNILCAFNDKKYTIVYTGDTQIFHKANNQKITNCNIICENYLNQKHILNLFDLVIFHGGFNTFMESLNAKIPMIGIPMGWDQGRVTELLNRFKIGDRVSFLNNSAEEIKQKANKLFSDKAISNRLEKLNYECNQKADFDEITKILLANMTNN